jgi:hypothetical protein
MHIPLLQLVLLMRRALFSVSALQSKNANARTPLGHFPVCNRFECTDGDSSENKGISFTDPVNPSIILKISC